MSYMSEKERAEAWRAQVSRVVLELACKRSISSTVNPEQFDADIEELESVVKSGGYL